MSERNLVDFLLWASEQQLVDEVKRLRATVDAALALHRSCADHPDCFDADPKWCHECGANHPCATVRALAPVADPDPHTISDKETT
jgi:hypothetical protein